LAILGFALFGFEFTIVSSIPLASELVPAARARFLAWMVVAMSLARGVGAALGPILFRSFGLPGPAIAAIVADVIAAMVLVVWVRERAATRSAEHDGFAGSRHG